MFAAQLRKYFGYDGLREGQGLILKAVEEGKDCLGVLPTGCGKSLCYQLPTLCMRSVVPTSVCVCVSPLVSLMEDQVSELNERFALDGKGRPTLRRSASEAPIAALIGSAQLDPSVEGRASKGEYAFVFLCPESCRRFTESLWSMNVVLVAVDESHCVSAQGHDFRPQYRTLGSIRAALGDSTPIVALTATANAAVAADIVESLGFREDYALVRTSSDRPNLHYSVLKKTTVKEDTATIASMLRSMEGSAFVYCITKREVDSMAERLAMRGLAARGYHAGMGMEDRAHIMTDFMEGRTTVLVATIAAGMGLNKADVRYVIHYGMSRNVSAYSQESGRAGRDGKPSRCVLFAGTCDIVTQHRFVSDDGNAAAERKKAAIRGMADYVSTRSCRRRVLLSEFGETLGSERCSLESGEAGCDRCASSNVVKADGSAVAVPILRAVQTLRYTGISKVVLFLRGSGDKKVSKLRRQPGYGSLRHLTSKSLKQGVEAVIEEGLLEQTLTDKGYPMISVSKAGKVAVATAGPIPLGWTAEEAPAKKAKVEGDRSDSKLFEALRSWRWTASKTMGVPVYTVCNNATLHAVAATKPGTLESLASIRGIGPQTITRHGEAILALIRTV